MKECGSSLPKKSLKTCNVAKKRLLQVACEETASRPYIEGRFVHVGELGAKLFCRPCKAVLSLTNVIKETRKGMHSTLHIKCRACDVLNKISTGKIHPGKSEKSFIPDIDSRILHGESNRIAPNF